MTTETTEASETITRSGRVYTLRGHDDGGRPVYVWKDPEDGSPTTTRALVYIPGLTRKATRITLDHRDGRALQGWGPQMLGRMRRVSRLTTNGISYVAA